MIGRARFKKLYLEHHSGVYKYFLRKGFPPEDAEELAQEVFFSVYKYGGDFNSIHKFRAWLNTISANIWKNRIRELHTQKRDAQVVSMDEKLVDTGVKESNGQPLDQTIERQQRELLREAVSQLPEKIHACVILRVYHELSYKEIAALLQIHYATVKSRLHQAQAILRQILSKDYNIDLLEN